jgi:hypothetical protein
MQIISILAGLRFKALIDATLMIEELGMLSCSEMNT